MNFEQGDNNPEKEQTPEAAEIANLDEKAGKVARQLEKADLDRMSPEEAAEVRRKVMKVVGAILAISGITMTQVIAYHESISPGDIHGIQDALRVYAPGLIPTFTGIGAFLQNYRKVEKG